MPICAYRLYIGTMVCGRLTLTPHVTKIGPCKVYETMHFLNLHVNPIDLSSFSLKLDQLEHLTPVIDLLLFDLYFENET